MSRPDYDYLEEGLLESYAMDLCSPAERDRVEKVLAVNHQARIDFEEIQEHLEKLAEIRAVQPPEEVKLKILDFLSEQPDEEVTTNAQNGKQLNKVVNMPVQPETQIVYKTPIWAYAAAIAALILGALFFQQRSVNADLVADRVTLQEQMNNFSAQMTNLQDQVSGLQEEKAFLNHMATRKILIHQDDGPNKLWLSAYWNPVAEKAVIDIKDMPEPPQGMCYQLWADVKGEMLPVAEIDGPVQNLRNALFYHNATTLNVTLEQGCGHAHPTVENLIVSEDV